ncbi:MAG TPA: sigma 54-interacting transcriptional regulator [Gemmatimonadaceae bacterium]|nr:sigma 54-interacting transcriptional regulator [Gemmatimonadaceae bacterium]
MNPYETPLIGDSMPMQKLRALIARIAPSKVPILIEGDTGTGKELVAASLHRQSGRDGAFVAFNVCALSESMFEDALFGHSKGAFTGAVGETPGFLREANGGTVFLDEISGLPLPHQAKLLRAVETGVVRPVGSSRDALTDFRLIVATNERLDDLVDQGRFRTDLAHRVCGLVLTVPALAQRVDDIPALVEHFVHRARPNVEVTRATIELLQSRTWRGNVRELRQVVEAALVMSGEVLDVGAVELVLGARGRDAAREVSTRALVERQRLLSVLGTTAWDTERAAAMLGVHRATIYRRMRRLGIPVPSLGATYSLGAGLPPSNATFVEHLGRSDTWAQM